MSMFERWRQIHFSLDWTWNSPFKMYVFRWLEHPCVALSKVSLCRTDGDDVFFCQN